MWFIEESNSDQSYRKMEADISSLILSRRKYFRL